LFAYASKNKKETFSKLIPAGYSIKNPADASDIASNVKKHRGNEFIFITPDSIFNESFNFDYSALKDQLKETENEFAASKEELKQAGQRKLSRVNLDSLLSKFEYDSLKRRMKIHVRSGREGLIVHNLDIDNFIHPNFDSINVIINNAFNHLKEVSLVMPVIPNEPLKGGELRFNYRFRDSLHKVDVRIPNIDSIIKKELSSDSLRSFRKFNQEFSREFEDGMLQLQKLDSLSVFFKSFSDSVMIFNKNEFKKEMQKLQKELRDFRIELNELQKEMKTDSTGTKQILIEI
jgi:hypothetical protein